MHSINSVGSFIMILFDYVIFWLGTQRPWYYKTKKKNNNKKNHKELDMDNPYIEKVYGIKLCKKIIKIISVVINIIIPEIYLILCKLSTITE